MKYFSILVLSIWVIASCGRQQRGTTRNAQEPPSPSSMPSDSPNSGSAGRENKDAPCSLYASPNVLKRGEMTTLSYQAAEILPPKTSEPVRGSGASITTEQNGRKVTIEMGSNGVHLAVRGNPMVYEVGPSATTTFRLIITSPTEACESSVVVMVN